MNYGTWSYHIFLGALIFLLILGTCSAVTPNAEISFTGQVVWQDIEGGFYGIITPDGTKYQPLNLPEEYMIDGVTVDVTGSIPSDVMTMQMWGEPIEIRLITPVNQENPFIEPWYTPVNQSQTRNETQADHLIMAASGLQTGLNTIDRQVSSSAKNLSLTGFDEKDLKNMLLQVLAIPGVYEVTFFDESGRLKAIVPEQFEHYVGEDVSGQDLNSRLLSYPTPGMSEYFLTIEGKDAVIVSYPVFSADKKVTGHLAALLDPAVLVRTSCLPLLNGTTFDLMVAEPDGTILYDGHPGMIGQETWNNTIFTEFPDLLSWTAHYQNAMAGRDQYSFYRNNSEDIVKTEVIWTTVALHGTPWRVFIMSR